MIEHTAYQITYKANDPAQARSRQTCIRFYADYETAWVNSKRVLAETFPNVIILSVEPIADPRKEAGR